MGRRITLLLTLFSVALVMTLSPLASLADPGSPPPPVWYSPTGLNPPPGLAGTSGRLAVMIELSEPVPSSDPASVASTASAPQRQQIDSAQNALLPYFAALNAQVLFRTSLAYNGIAVSIPANQIARLRTLPDVVKVSVIPTKLPASPATAQASIAHTSHAASAVAAATGQGVRIGVIDRGIDYTHADFGGLGGYAGNNPAIIEPGSFPTSKVDGFDFAGDAYNASGANVIPAPDADPLECNSADLHNGQGTHVAGLAAGAGVAADGSTYHGPYGPTVDLSTLKVAPGIAPEAHLYALKIFGCQGSTALLTQAIERAIDPDQNGDASDHLDVLVISVGTAFGSADDPDAIAVDNAVRAGIIVVVAAGDNISTFYSVASPASASLAIAVGATDTSGAVAAFSSRGPQRGNSALKPDLVAPGVNLFSAALGSGAESTARTGTAFAAAQVAGAAALLRQLHGTWTPAQVKAALMDTATPVQAPPSLAGAGRLNLTSLDGVNVLAYGLDNNSVGLNYGAPWVASAWTATHTLQLENMGEATRVITLSATTVATETGVVVNVPSAPITIPAHSTAQAIVGMTIDPAGLEFTPDRATQLLQSGFARNYLAEHGGSIEINAVNSASGTRVRPAHAAHFASVDFYLDDQLLDDSLDSREVHAYTNTTPGAHTVKLRKPGASPTSRPIFSAPVDLLDGKDYTLVVVGRPHELGVVVVDETVPAPPAFGQALIHFVNANRIEPHWDIGPLDVYLDGVLKVAALPVGATSPYFALSPGTHEVRFLQAGVTGRNGSHKTFVASAGTAILLGTGRHDDDDHEIDDNEQRPFIGVGDTRLGVTLLGRVPFQVFPTLAANTHAATPLNVSPSAHAFTLGLRNTGARNTGLVASQATARTPLASAFELEATSPLIAGLSPNLRGADIQYIGLTSSYSVTQSLSPFTFLYFGLSSYGPWSTPNEVELQIYIDSNGDGRDDFVLTNTNTGVANVGTSTNGAPTDVFVSVLYPLRLDGTIGPAFAYSFWGSFGATVPSTVNMAPFNSSAMFQVANILDLGIPLDPNNPLSLKGPPPSSICYHVETRARDLGNFGQVVDRVPAIGSPPILACGNRAGVLRYDIQHPAIAPVNTTNFIFGAPTFARPLFVDVDGGQITGAINPTLLAARPGQKLLILHHHNAPFPQAETVDISVGTALKPAQLVGMLPRTRVPLVMR